MCVCSSRSTIDGSKKHAGTNTGRAARVINFRHRARRVGIFSTHDRSDGLSSSGIIYFRNIRTVRVDDFAQILPWPSKLTPMPTDLSSHNGNWQMSVSGKKSHCVHTTTDHAVVCLPGWRRVLNIHVCAVDNVTLPTPLILVTPSPPPSGPLSPPACGFYEGDGNFRYSPCANPSTVDRCQA